ncbi:MAG TPA: DUF1552 domain-containing protein [Terriglobia bacterium]|nr:DUF1552 domain-containing protein [Terriglobia bacterium]
MNHPAFVFGKAIPRRTFLRGAGAALALPWLESMRPAFAGPSSAAAKSVNRLSIVYVPNGIIMDHWTPAQEGPHYEMTPTLEPLAAFRNQFLLLSGLNQNQADPAPGEGESAPHERAGATFLTGVHPKREGNVGISVDQIAAQALGRETPIASLELGLHETDVVGQCEKQWSCAYLNTLSWRTATTPLPIENDPRRVFERLFGEGASADPAARQARLQSQRSLLDSVIEAASAMMSRLGPADRRRLGEYLDGIRDVERRIQMAELQSQARNGDAPPLSVERPVGVPARLDDYAKLMLDLQVLAFQSDLTRVITFMMGREQSNRTYREIGVPDAHHGLSHHGMDPAKIAKVIQIDHFHTTLFAYYLEKMRSTPEGDGSLLDHSMILYGSALSDGNEHLNQNLPILLAGGGAGPFARGAHRRYPKDTPLTNLYLTLLDKLGVRLERFGDSNGQLELLSVG